MECLSLCPNEFSLTEAYELMEGLSTLRPKQVQELLGACKSIKAKRLFLYFAEKAGHSWFKYIDLTYIPASNNRNKDLQNIRSALERVKEQLKRRITNISYADPIRAEEDFLF